MADADTVTTQSVAGKSLGQWILTVLKWIAIAILSVFAWLVLIIILMLFLLTPTGMPIATVVLVIGIGFTIRGFLHMKNADEDPMPSYGRGVKFCLIGFALTLAQFVAVVECTPFGPEIYIDAPATPHQQP